MVGVALDDFAGAAAQCAALQQRGQRNPADLRCRELGLGAEPLDPLEKRHPGLTLDLIHRYARLRRAPNLRSACADRWRSP
jgi:hypothetical protein